MQAYWTFSNFLWAVVALTTVSLLSWWHLPEVTFFQTAACGFERPKENNPTVVVANRRQHVTRDTMSGESAPVKLNTSTKVSRVATVTMETHRWKLFFLGSLLFCELIIAAADLNLNLLVELGVSPNPEPFFPLLAKQVCTLDRSTETKVKTCTKIMTTYKTATKVRKGGENCDTEWKYPPLKVNQ